MLIDEMQKYVDSLSIDEARTVHGLIVKRINAIMHFHETAALLQYNVGERVAFHSASRHIEGLVVRINLRTVSVIDNIGKRWTVAPQFLMKVETSRHEASRPTLLQTGNHPNKRKSASKKRKKKKR